MAFEKIITITLKTETPAKMVEYVDLFIKSYGDDPTTMNNQQKEDFIKTRFFGMLKDGIRNASRAEKRRLLVDEDVDGTITV